MEIKYIEATTADIPTLVDYRIHFLTGLLGDQSPEDVNTLRQHLEKYFTTAIPDRTIICRLAKDGDVVAGLGVMTIRQHPGTFKNPSGIMGYMANMYTLPAYRRMGICAAILRQLTDTGRQMGITAFELHATKEGAYVYSKNGFEKHNEPTYRMYT